MFSKNYDQPGHHLWCQTSWCSHSQSVTFGLHGKDRTFPIHVPYIKKKKKRKNQVTRLLIKRLKYRNELMTLFNYDMVSELISGACPKKRSKNRELNFKWNTNLHQLICINMYTPTHTNKKCSIDTHMYVWSFKKLQDTSHYHETLPGPSFGKWENAASTARFSSPTVPVFATSISSKHEIHITNWRLKYNNVH